MTKLAYLKQDLVTIVVSLLFLKVLHQTVVERSCERESARSMTTVAFVGVVFFVSLCEEEEEEEGNPPHPHHVGCKRTLPKISLG